MSDDGQHCDGSFHRRARSAEHQAESEDRGRDDHQAEAVRQENSVHERPVRECARCVTDRRARLTVLAEHARKSNERRDKHRRQRGRDDVPAISASTTDSHADEVCERENQELDPRCDRQHADRRNVERQPVRAAGERACNDGDGDEEDWVGDRL